MTLFKLLVHIASLFGHTLSNYQRIQSNEGNQCCYNTECVSDYQSEDKCFMATVYASDHQRQGYCWDSHCEPFEGTCQPKQSYGNYCINTIGYSDDLWCVTGYCSDTTRNCELRNPSERGCLPTDNPTIKPTRSPASPSNPNIPTKSTKYPSVDPTNYPTNDPTYGPTKYPSVDPTNYPTNYPTKYPSVHPTNDESVETKNPSVDPTNYPTNDPTNDPTKYPSVDPTNYPTNDSTNHPTKYPSVDPTKYPPHPTVINPTVDPTNPAKHHINFPTEHPIIIAKHPTVGPTFAIQTHVATKPPSVSHNHQSSQSILLLSFALALILCICMAIALKTRSQKDKIKPSEFLKMRLVQNEPDDDRIVVQNAMVILLAIGMYDENPGEPDVELECGAPNIIGIEKDIQNLHRAFGANNLNYTICPQYDVHFVPKLEWTQNELIEFLNEKATFLDDNLETFDGLIVVISGHGLKGHICTSDCKMMQKTAIHRIFSQNHPSVRNIPRIFLFDCCDGQFDCSKGVKIKNKDNINGPNATDCSKRFTLEDVESQTQKPWKPNEKNPDYRLVEVNAANPGFQSKLHIQKGSYMLSEFTERIILNLENKKTQCIGEIFDDIQQTLSEKRKQHIIATYNDRTRYIIFKRNVKNVYDNDVDNTEHESKYNHDDDDCDQRLEKRSSIELYLHHEI